MTMITPSYLGETIEYSSLHACRSTLEDPTAKEMLARHPDEILRLAIWGMTGKSNLARHQMKKLKIYASAEHPHAAQNPQPLPAGVTRRTVVSKTK